MIIIFLVTCTTACATHSQKTDRGKNKEFIQFINKPDSALLAWGENWNSENDSLWLTVDTSYGFFVLDEKNILIGGSFAKSDGTIQSVLLKTSDVGKSWKEVMNPIESTHIEFVYFPSKKEGYAVGDWATESTGEELVLYRSADEGNTWEELDPFKKPHYTCVCQNITQDTSGLRMIINCQGGTPIDGVYTYVSGDKANTWKEVSFKSYKEFKSIRERFSFPVANAEKTAFDTSVWKLGYTNNKLAVLKNISGKWETKSTLPLKYGWKKGILSYK